MTRIAIAGAAGRMGRMLIAETLATTGARLTAAGERPGHPLIGRDAADGGGVAITDDPAALVADADVLIDFSHPDGVLALAPLAAGRRVALVVGTTGLADAHRRALAEAAVVVPVVVAANMSIGVTLLAGLTRQVAGILGPEADIEIVEMHHRHKVDAPSGTALALGAAAAAGRGVALDDVAVRSRDGHTGPRPAGAIGFAVLRGGDVVGDHTVVFACDGERIELTHKASSRAVFARGALRAALWTQGRSPGLYGMTNVLGVA